MSAVVGSRQLESIQSLLQRSANDGKSLPCFPHILVVPGSHRATLSKQSTPPKLKARIPLGDDDLIESVMHQVAEFNQDKLPEASLVKVLADVYLDAKSKLGKTSAKCSDLSSSTTVECVLPCSLPNSETSEVVESKSHSTLAAPAAQPVPMSVSEKKRLKWESERAEMAALAAQTSWGTESLGNSTIRNHRSSQSFVDACPDPQRTTATRNDQLAGKASLTYTSATSLPALTPMAFAVNQDVDLLKREEQRRQWKNALDEQIREQRALREKRLLEERQENLALLDQLQGGVDSGTRTVLGSNSQSSPNVNPLSNASLFHPHPSASHFSTSVPIPDLMCTDLGAVATTKPVSQFNRTRGFTQTLYSSPADEAARLRRAEEIQRANLEQIEEHRRIRELERANRLLEDKLEEERLERERAQLRAVVEAENKEKQLREMEENTRTQILFDSLKQAREEAANYRTQVRFRRSGVDQQNPTSHTGDDDGGHTIDSKPQTKVAAYANPSAQMNMGSTYTMNLDTVLNKVQVPVVTSSVGDTEDAACQTGQCHLLSLDCVPFSVHALEYRSSCFPVPSYLDPVSITSPNSTPVRAKASVGTANAPGDRYPVVGQTRRKIANSGDNVSETSHRLPPIKRAPQRTQKAGNNCLPTESFPSQCVDRLRTPKKPIGTSTVQTQSPLKSIGETSNRISNGGHYAAVPSNARKTQAVISAIQSDRNPTRIPVPVSSSTKKPTVRHRDSPPSTPPLSRYTDGVAATHYPLNLVRTHDVLDPNYATITVPVIRENTAKPTSQQSCLTDKVPDPVNSRSDRQNSILQHLSEIRKGHNILPFIAGYIEQGFLPKINLFTQVITETDTLKPFVKPRLPVRVPAFSVRTLEEARQQTAVAWTHFLLMYAAPEMTTLDPRTAVELTFPSVSCRFWLRMSGDPEAAAMSSFRYCRCHYVSFILSGLCRRMRVRSICSLISWTLLSLLFVSSFWRFACVIFITNPTDTPSVEPPFGSAHRVPSVFCSFNSLWAIPEFWPRHITTRVLPDRDLTVFIFSSHPPFPNSPQLSDPTFILRRKQVNDLLIASLHGLVSHVIWVYPSWRRDSLPDLHTVTKFELGIASISFADAVPSVRSDSQISEHRRRSLSKDNPRADNDHSELTTLCLCPSSGSPCTLPLLYSFNLDIPPETCSRNVTVVFEQVIDLIVESKLVQTTQPSDTKHNQLFQSLFTKWRSVSMDHQTTEQPWPLNSRFNFDQWPIVFLFEANYFGSNQPESRPVLVPPSSALITFRNLVQKLIIELLDSTKNDQLSIHLATRFVDLVIPTIPLNTASLWTRQVLGVCACDLPQSDLLTKSKQDSLFLKWATMLSISTLNRTDTCSRLQPAINPLLLSDKITPSAATAALNLWNWLCHLDIEDLLSIVSWVPCDIASSASSHHPVDLCPRSIAIHPSSSVIPTLEQSLLLYRLTSILKNLPVPRLITMVGHPTAGPSDQESTDHIHFRKLCDVFANRL
ncbi:hypothetical protein T265_01963 [Opisthorchis viverrini]|uniref:CCDC66 domain-containing protein n=1 Tax=Opisthorchis viverrini TaxID=6198 RepID=A0A074ZWN7_OPIVI|nr:hypothetical protein T265_01963 [Opisthorchis viverrini]KER31873.1 hypothetical protein T265_01963 [Opisthorchis viverrini]